MQPWMQTLTPLLPHQSAVRPVRCALANYLVDHDVFAARRALKEEGLLPLVEPVLDDVLHTLRGDQAYRVYRALLGLVRKYPKVFRKHRKLERFSPLVWAGSQQRYPDVHPDVLRVTWRALSEKNRDKLLADANDERFTTRTAHPTVVQGLTQWLAKYAKRIAYRKLRFLAQNDGGTSNEDLAAELLHYAVRSFKESEFLEGTRGRPNRAYMRNYALQAMHNRALSIIQEQQTQKRARVIRVSEAEGSKCAEYQRTVLFLDRRPTGHSHVSTQDTFVSLADTTPVYEPTEEKLYVSQVRDRLNSIERRVIDTYLGTRHDPFWEEWARDNKVDLKDPTSPAALRALCTYHGIELSDLQHHFRPCDPRRV